MKINIIVFYFISIYTDTWKHNRDSRTLRNSEVRRQVRQQQDSGTQAGQYRSRTDGQKRVTSRTEGQKCDNRTVKHKQDMTKVGQ